MKIVVTDRSLFAHRETFEAHLPETARASWHQVPDEAAVLADLADAEVLVGSRLTAEMAAAAPRLRLVHAPGAGTDGIDLAALPESVLCANTFHHENSIAEYIVATLISLRRDLRGQDAALRAGVWHSPVHDESVPQPTTLRGSTVTLLGFGHIGRRAWELLRVLGCRGIAITRRGAVDDAGLDWAGTTADLDRALQESDVLVVSIPLSSSTTGLVSAGELASLGPGGLLVNVARGPVVAERDLYEALSGGVIGGAALDVWYRYPGTDGRGEPSTLPFRDLPNVLLTPHTSGVTAETFGERAREIAVNISRLAAGQALLNPVATR